MTTETTPRSLVAKLAEVMAEVERVAKHGRNDFHKYDYATEADILAAVREHMAKRSLMLIPTVERVEWRQLPDKNGKERDPICTMTVLFTVLDGEAKHGSRSILTRDMQAGEITWIAPDHLTFRVIGEGQDSGDKATYKAMTGATKYALLKLFLIPTGDDPESEGAQHRNGRPAVEEIGRPDRVTVPTTDAEVAAAFPPGLEQEMPDPRPAFRAGNRACPNCGRKVFKRKDGSAWFCWQQKGGCGMQWTETPQVNQETGEVTEPRDPDMVQLERDALWLKANKLAVALKLPAEQRLAAWKTYLGDATKDNADPVAMRDLVAWLETRVANDKVVL